MRIQADQTKCIGAGQCVMTAPDVFDQREDDGVVQTLNAQPPAEHQAAAREAAALCPAAVITVTEQ